MYLYNKPLFIAPPAERHRSLSNAELSVVRLSVCPSIFSFFGMELIRDDINHMHLGGYLLQNCTVTYSLLWHSAAQEGY